MGKSSKYSYAKFLISVVNYTARKKEKHLGAITTRCTGEDLSSVNNCVGYWVLVIIPLFSISFMFQSLYFISRLCTFMIDRLAYRVFYVCYR